MTEKEYITATNRVKVSLALTIMRDVMDGDEYGISEEEYKEIVKNLREAEIKLFAAVQVSNDAPDPPRFAHGGIVPKTDDKKMVLALPGRGWWQCKKCGLTFEAYTTPPLNHVC